MRIVIKKQERLKIEVAAEDKKGLEAEVSMHFGRCPYYVILEKDDGKIKEPAAVIENPYARVHGPPGQVPSFLTHYEIQAIMAGGMGPRAVRMFIRYGIKVVTEAHGKVKEAVTSFLRGDLTGSEPCH
ncbi:dinitrogenase iron-molybdenum cofactor biosynthesis protein [Candidatus Aerophobetes bacterium]|uniref:Dinitrogenase iron-molybdenum cofactor biosynthesis protein n=1 Tax=Aerophobetes bacterium TaxID=2030807 RepID=A0A523W583_UNCAE|nr:MAG: dinitrogenase iron-molybdenum cofactor biosynthesis protein [Candidatus Aerophobetes bacterium]